MLPIQVISAPSILGLKPTGVEKLPESLLSHGLSQRLNALHPVIKIPVLNSKYDFNRDRISSCLNAPAIRQFSIALGKHLTTVLDKNYFPLVLGGDCSILIGILSALKAKGSYGLIFYDAHADFYEPEKSITGEVADMDLAIVTGRGPEILTDINGLHPYVADEHVIHIGQRDWEETRKYGSRDIRETVIRCFDHESINKSGTTRTIQKITHAMNAIHVDGFWIHFDTDVLSDEENPAVDYRLPGGLSSERCEQLLRGVLSTNKIIGMTVTIFNPTLDDEQGTVAKMLTNLLSRSLTC